MSQTGSRQSGAGSLALSNGCPSRPALLLSPPQPAADQQLYKEGVLLEDDKTLAELRVENDDELAVAYRSEGKPESLAI